MISSASLEKIADRVVDADVLVLGAGAAGCLAAVAAREKGAKKVVIVDKGAVVSCGCTGTARTISAFT